MADAPDSPPAPSREMQLTSLRALIGELLKGNAFYARRLRAAGINENIDSLDTFAERMPFTFKDDLTADQQQNPPYGTNLTYPLERYTRFCQTSGTTGEPMRWLDTPESWASMLACWRRVFQAAGISAGDRVFFAFSFGPFLGFWTAFEAALDMGVMAMPGGGMSSTTRLQVILDNEADAVCCTPTYALRLAEVAAAHGMDLARAKVRRIIVAGEPGGSIPAVRSAIEAGWPTARVFDHHGMTEVGPVSYENANHPGTLHIMEEAFCAEVLDVQTQQTVAADEVGELVLTTLKRTACPLLRYRTGDLVRPSARSAEELGSADLALDGGILGRCDDMVVIRGVNIYPAAIDRIVRRFAEVAEYRAEIATVGGMCELSLRIEPAAESGDAGTLCKVIGAALRDAFHLRVPVTPVAPGTLPRFEMKAQRWIRK